MNNLSFSELSLSAEILRALQDMGFEKATPIQSQSIPPLMNGNDLLGQAQTGTGKTCAFGIPVIEQVDIEDTHVQYLILSPTRELAMQITDELHELAKYKEGLRVLSVYGGQPIERQILALKRRPQIVVGTPGRVLDHMRRKTIRLGNLRGLILDEADEMLNMGFKEDIDMVLQATPEHIQRICFSATMPAGIMKITNEYLNDAVHVQIEPKQRTVLNIEQRYIEVRENQKQEVMIRLLESQQSKLGLIFCNTKKRVDEVYAVLQKRGLSAEALHGDMKQMSRTRVMNRFKTGDVKFLVATDVAARGIDVDDIEIVVNYDLPQDEEYYVHRIGRTGRAGRDGTAITFVVGHELVLLRNFAHRTQSTISTMEIPSLKELINTRAAGMLSRAAKVSAKKSQALETYKELIMEYLLDNPEIELAEITAALLRQSMGDSVLQAKEIEPVVPYDKLSKISRSNNRPMRRQGGYNRRSTTDNRAGSSDSSRSYGRRSSGKSQAAGKSRDNYGSKRAASGDRRPAGKASNYSGRGKINSRRKISEQSQVS